MIRTVDLAYKVYRADNITLIVAPHKIIVQTPLQEFYLDPQEKLNKEDFALIAFFIENGNIRDMATLRSKISGRFYLQATHKRHEIMHI